MDALGSRNLFDVAAVADDRLDADQGGTTVEKAEIGEAGTVDPILQARLLAATERRPQIPQHRVDRRTHGLIG
ncbi:hypothetical protein D3C84_1206200 [compost metagenome]